jgi:hypothetical protein
VLPLSGAPLLTSSHTPWAGFLLEVHSSHRLNPGPSWEWKRNTVGLVTKGSLHIRVSQAGCNQDLVSRAGTVSIFPCRFGPVRFCLDRSDFELTCVELDPSRASRLLGQKRHAGVGSLHPQIAIKDPQIAALLLSMKAEVSEGCPSGELYARSLSLALISLLENRFSDDKLEHLRDRQRFSHSQAQRLLGFGLIQIQKAMIAARTTADRKLSASLS